MKLENLNRGGQEYTCPSLSLIEVRAEYGFASSNEKVGIYAGSYVDGEEF